MKRKCDKCHKTEAHKNASSEFLRVISYNSVQDDNSRVASSTLKYIANLFIRERR